MNVLMRTWNRILSYDYQNPNHPFHRTSLSQASIFSRLSAGLNSTFMLFFSFYIDFLKNQPETETTRASDWILCEWGRGMIWYLMVNLIKFCDFVSSRVCRTRITRIIYRYCIVYIKTQRDNRISERRYMYTI